MIRISYLMICISIILFFSSCGSDEEINPDNQLIGNWKGELTQPNFGLLALTLNITNLDVSGSSGNGSYKSINLSNCDDSQFICEPLMCNFTLSLLSISGRKYELDQMLLGTSTCGDGIFDVTAVDDNNIDVVWYQEAYPDNRASGRLSK